MSQDLNLSVLPSTVPLPPREHKLRQRGSSAEGLCLWPDEVRPLWAELDHGEFLLSALVLIYHGAWGRSGQAASFSLNLLWYLTHSVGRKAGSEGAYLSRKPEHICPSAQDRADRSASPGLFGALCSSLSQGKGWTKRESTFQPPLMLNSVIIHPIQI